MAFLDKIKAILGMGPKVEAAPEAPVAQVPESQAPAV